MTKKQQLYFLLEAYNQNKYDIATFCDELTRILYYESNGISELSGNEKEYFEDLANVTERYSPFEDDRKLSKWYVDDEAVKKAINTAYDKLIANKNF